MCRPTFTTGFIGKHVDLICKELQENGHSILVLFFLGTVAKLRQANLSFIIFVCLSVRPSVRPSFLLSAWKNSDPTGRIFMKFYIRLFLENLLRKLNFHQYLTRLTNNLHKGQYALLIRYRSVLLTVRNVSNESCRQIKTHILYSVKCFRIRAVYEIMWKNTVEPDWLQMTI